MPDCPGVTMSHGILFRANGPTGRGVRSASVEVTFDITVRGSAGPVAFAALAAARAIHAFGHPVASKFVWRTHSFVRLDLWSRIGVRGAHIEPCVQAAAHHSPVHFCPDFRGKCPPIRQLPVPKVLPIRFTSRRASWPEICWNF